MKDPYIKDGTVFALEAIPLHKDMQKYWTKHGHILVPDDFLYQVVSIVGWREKDGSYAGYYEAIDDLINQDLFLDPVGGSPNAEKVQGVSLLDPVVTDAMALVLNYADYLATEMERLKLFRKMYERDIETKTLQVENDVSLLGFQQVHYPTGVLLLDWNIMNVPVCQYYGNGYLIREDQFLHHQTAKW